MLKTSAPDHRRSRREECFQSNPAPKQFSTQHRSEHLMVGRSLEAGITNVPSWSTKCRQWLRPRQNQQQRKQQAAASRTAAALPWGATTWEELPYLSQFTGTQVSPRGGKQPVDGSSWGSTNEGQASLASNSFLASQCEGLCGLSVQFQTSLRNASLDLITLGGNKISPERGQEVSIQRWRCGYVIIIWPK